MSHPPADRIVLDRFWVPAAKDYQLDSNGWLIDPRRSLLGNSLNPNVLMPASLLEARCLILLGEPGMGKSHSVAHLADVEQRQTGLQVVQVDLGRYPTEFLLQNGLFESPPIREWRNGQANICLYLDSFDEAATRYNALEDLFRFHLQSWPIDRLLLRVACRAAEWPSSMSEILRSLFDNSMTTVELLPLRRDDARSLINRVDPDELLTSVERAGLGPFAARPLTLRLIAGAFDLSAGMFEGRPADIYERGLLSMCEEFDEGRRNLLTSDQLTAGQKLDCATRLAALSILTGRVSLWTGMAATVPVSVLTEEDVVAMNTAGEPFPGNARTVFRQVIRTGLFTRLEPDTFTWAHATFMSYLAARWIRRSQLTQQQARSLLTSPDGRLYPQLAHVAGWLVALAPAEFGWLVGADPESFLLGTDIPTDELRAIAVEAILERARDGNLFHEYSRELRGLSHPNLGDQLAGALCDENSEVRRIAIDIARACRISDVLPRLVEIGNDIGRPMTERTAAIVASDDMQGPVRSLNYSTVLHEQIEDAFERSEIVGAALLASWPHRVTNAEALSVLTFRPPENLFGLHSAFIHELAKNLRPEDLVPAMQWLRMIGEHPEDSWSRPLADATIHLALTNPHTDAYLVAMDRVRGLLLNYDRIFERSSPWTLDQETRRRVALDLLSDGPDEIAFATVSIANLGSGLLGSDDFAWLTTIYPASAGKVRNHLQRVIRLIFNVNDRTHVDLLLDLPEAHPVAIEILSDWIKPIDLESEEARTLRERWIEMSTPRGRDDPTILQDDAELNERIATLAAEASDGDLAAYWIACRLITVRPLTRYYYDEWKPDLTTHQRWNSLPEGTRHLLVRASRGYLLNGACQPDEWVGKKLNFFPAHAGYRALIILRRFEPAALVDLPADVWREWAPIIATWPAYESDARDSKHDLIQRAMPAATSEMLSAVMATACLAWSSGQRAFLNDEIAHLWNTGLEGDICAELRLTSSGEATDEILDLLLTQRSVCATEFLLDQLSDDARHGDPDGARRAAIRLLRTDARAAWPILCRLLEEDSAFMEAVALELGMDRSPPNLGEAELAELYLWLTDHFPPEEDLVPIDAHFVEPREEVAHWRHAILQAISSQGTPEAIVAIRRIMAARPEDHWMGRVLVSAESAFRRASWQPLDARAIGGLASSTRSRIVKSTADLASAVTEALAEIQQLLQGDTPDAPVLWDTVSRRPKYEDEVTDYLRNRLRERLAVSGVVVNREVQVRRITGIGERTDLRIDATTSDPDEPIITIVGEVKGCWYDDLVGPVSDQLVDRYMSRVGTSTGLYIIVWFDQDSWDPADRRRSVAGRRTPESVDDELGPVLQRLLESGITIQVLHVNASR